MDTTQIGASVLRTRTATRHDIALLTEVTGDRDPIHYDADSRQPAGWAPSSARRRDVRPPQRAGRGAAARAGQRLPRGGVALPGRGAPRDVITAHATAMSIRSDKPVTTLATQVASEVDITVLDGIAVVWRDPVVAAASTREPHHADAGRAGITTERKHR